MMKVLLFGLFFGIVAMIGSVGAQNPAASVPGGESAGINRKQNQAIFPGIHVRR